jgi:hypothetical protein
VTDEEGLQIELQEAYANAYNEVVQPDRVFVASQYFRRKWVPLLGADLAWLILAMRQRCYWNKKTGEVRNVLLASQDELAVEVGLDRRHVQKLLQSKYASWFILEKKQRYEYDQRIGKTVRAKTAYKLRMDDPLTPEDRDELSRKLEQKKAGITVDGMTGQVDMLQALDRMMASPLCAKSDLGEGSYAPKATTVYAPATPTNTSTDSTPEIKKEDTSNDIWQAALQALEPQLGRGLVATCRSLTRGERINGHWRVECGNDYWRDWLENRAKARIVEELSAQVGEPVQGIEFVKGRVQ